MSVAVFFDDSYFTNEAISRCPFNYYSTINFFDITWHFVSQDDHIHFLNVTECAFVFVIYLVDNKNDSHSSLTWYYEIYQSVVWIRNTNDGVYRDYVE